MSARKHKMTVYVPHSVFNEMQLEAERQERSMSWLVERSWKLALQQVKSAPTSVPFSPSSGKVEV